MNFTWNYINHKWIKNIGQNTYVKVEQKSVSKNYHNQLINKTKKNTQLFSTKKRYVQSSSVYF